MKAERRATEDMGMERPRVIISLRVSSEDQRERGYGHASQLRRLPELVAEQGWELATRPDGTLAIYDEGAASTTMAEDDDLDLAARPVMAALIRELGETRPTYLVCRKLDRLHRSNLQWQYLQHRLRLAGVEGVAQFPALAGHPEMRRIQNPRDRAFAAMEAAWASLEKEELKEKLMTARRERAVRGLPNGGRTPYGYARPKPRGPLVVVEEEAQVYRQMVEWTIEGRGSAWIAHELTKRGVPTRSRRRGWTATTVRRVLESEAQTGRIHARFGDEDQWLPAADQPAIVERDRWQLARQVLAGRSRGSGSNAKRHALAGLLRCSACGATLKATVNRPKRADGTRRTYWHYTCKVYNSGCTEGYTISERRAIAELAALVAERLKATRGQWVEPSVTATDTIGHVEERLGHLTTALADAELRVRRAHAAWIDAPDDMAEMALDELRTRQSKARELRAELEDAQAGYAAAQQAPMPEVEVEELRKLLDDWTSFSDDRKRAVLEAVVDHAVLDPPGRARRLRVVWADGTSTGDEGRPSRALAGDTAEAAADTTG